MRKILFLLVLFGATNSLFAQSDDCSGAVTLTPGATCVTTAFTNNEDGQPEAGTPNPSCMTGTESSDVWYRFTGTGGTVDITLSGANRSSTVGVWTNCPATTQVGCMNVANGASGTLSIATTSGTTYYIQIVRTSGNNTANHNGDICLVAVAPAPANDNCATATPITQGTSCVTTAGTVTGATNSGITSCTGTADDDVWYRFTATNTTAIITRTTTGGWDSGVEIFASTGAAPGSCIGASLGCQDAETDFTVTGLTVGMNYYVRVYYWFTGGINPGDFTICVTEPPTLPAGSIVMTSGGSSSTCSGSFYDPGGGLNYPNSVSAMVHTICPSTAGAKLKAIFSSFQTEGTLDYLEIFDGNSTAAPLIGTYSGTTSPGTVQASASNASGCLTFRFTSDGSVNYAGWIAALSCVLPCQTITANLVSTNEAAAGDGIIKICQGQSVNFVGSGTFSSSSAGATYTWSMGNGATVSGTNVNYTWPAVGSYLVNLTITDPSGCTNTNYFNQQVQVSTTPTITTSATPSTLCTNQTSALAATVTMTPYTINCTPPVSGTTFLPDGSGVSYSTSITTNCYSPSATVTSLTDITNICLNMEHSYSGDLSMSIVCPNGQSANLITYPSGTGSANLGTPWATATVDGSSTTTTPGVGANYCFSSTASTAWASASVTGGTFVSGNGPGTYTDTYIPAGSYLPMQSLSTLIGCPLNGSWTIQVTDNLGSDNGYIFSWDINFNAALLTASSFTPTIASQGWVAASTLTSTGATTANVVPVSQGTPCYTYSVTDNFGCTYTSPQCITVNCGSSLPVGLISFEASAVSNERVRLDWVTSSETNSDYFLIERSIDGENWEAVTEHDAAGYSTETIDYVTFDNAPYPGTSYYRLSQYDMDGELGTTDMEAVYLDFEGEGELVVFPNPSSTLVTVKGDLVSLSTFEVLNMLGQNLRYEIPSYDQGDGSVVLDISGLASGVYSVKYGSRVISLVKE